MYRVTGGFEIDLRRQCLRTAQGELHLRPKTFSVLKLLVENRERMVSKSELLETVWKDTAVTEDVLVTSITELRKAFSDDARTSRYIRTVHGLGYRWIAELEEQAEVRSPRRMLRPAALAAGVLLAVVAAAALLRVGRETGGHETEIAWWRFAEGSGDTVIDSSGHGNSGKLNAAARRISGALEFDGTNGGAWGKTTGFFPLGNAPRTIAVRVKTNSTAGDFTNIFGYGVSGSRPPAASFTLSLAPDGRLQAGNGYFFGTVKGKAPIDDGSWHSIATTYEGPATNFTRVYVDGQEDAAGPLSSPPATLSGSWAIGQFLGPGTFFRGAIADVRLFDRALRPGEVNALARCSTQAADLRGEDGRNFYFLPVFYGIPRIVNGEVFNQTRDLSGIQLAESGGSCAESSLDGASVGQDLYLSADLKAPGDAAGHITEAGIYFRSRKAHAGDGIVGGTSAGYLVRLRTGGQVLVMCMNPGRVVAFANVPNVAPDAYHRLEVIAVAEKLQARLDGKLLEFDQSGEVSATVSIPPLWEKIGHNDGAAGIAFAADLNRGQLGGQTAKNFTLRPATRFF